MIVDRLANLDLYRGLAPRWVKALEFLRDSDLLSLSLGRHDLDGDRLFALVQDYETKPTEQCRWEAHRRYCDIQFDSNEFLTALKYPDHPFAAKIAVLIDKLKEI